MKTVAALEYLKLRTAVALKAWNQAATAAGLVLWTPVLRVPVMEEIPVGRTLAVVQEGRLTCEAE
jgi:hypothetical protein